MMNEARYHRGYLGIKVPVATSPVMSIISTLHDFINLHAWSCNLVYNKNSLKEILKEEMRSGSR
jgi:hypothetical protein